MTPLEIIGVLLLVGAIIWFAGPDMPDGWL